MPEAKSVQVTSKKNRLMTQQKLEPAITPAFWRGRLFKNSYTHGGHRYEVKAWSVKIQHQGRRRTFTFPFADKAASARKALAIYRTIRRSGWGSLAGPRRRSPEPGSGKSGPISFLETVSKTDIHFWRDRLGTRKYPALPPTSAPLLSANISHEGREVWFPLGTAVVETAATKALEIYSTIVERGWPVACRRFPREVNLAVHWTANPMAWTYTTFHTRIAECDPLPKSPERVQASKANLDVALIEPEKCLRRALAGWIDAEIGTGCVATYPDLREALRDNLPAGRALWLVNRDLPAMTGSECLEKLKRLVPNFCGLTYSIYNDSEHLFAASVGGAQAYLFKRTLPDEILQPLHGIAPGQMLSMENIQQLVRKYFQHAIAMVLPDETMRRLETLTQREHEILQSLGKGYLDKEIANKLGISAWTVRGHVKKIFRKLQTHTRTEAVIQYLQR